MKRSLYVVIVLQTIHTFLHYPLPTQLTTDETLCCEPELPVNFKSVTNDVKMSTAF